MKQPAKVMILVCLCLGAARVAFGGEISGTVKGPDGKSVKGVFVAAKEESTKITVDVLTDRSGNYRIENLAPGQYEITANAVGYKSAARALKVEGNQTTSLDIPLQKDIVHWSDLSIHQGQVMLPDAPGKELLFTHCMTCHGLQTKIAATRRNEEGWQNCVALMRDRANGVGDLRITEADGAVVAKYLSQTFSPDSELPRSPADLPEYSKVKHGEFSDEAMKIVYVMYSFPGPNRIPWVAYPNSDKSVWIPKSWTADGIVHLDPQTGKMQEFSVPSGTRKALHVHAVLEAPDGIVWFTEDAACALGKFDPSTGKFSVYQPAFCSPKDDDAKTGRGMHSIGLGSVNSLRIDPSGKIWAGGSILLRFDPQSEKFMEFPEAETPYGIDLDPQGNIWFAEFPHEGKIGRMDTKTLKITKWTPPTTTRLAELNKDRPAENYVTGNTYPKTAGPRRIAVDAQGTVWFGEWWGKQIGRFDPKTETFKEFPLPDPDPTPYAVGVDHNGFVWYSSFDDDILGRVDPNTGNVVEFPFPYSGNELRELMPDEHGRMWFGTPFNNKVGYFVPPADEAKAAKQ